MDEDNIRSFLNELKDKELIKHYVFVDEIKCAFEKSEVWIDPITDFLKRKKGGPIYIGKSFIDLNRLHKDWANSEHILEGDWKGFDSTMYIRLIT